MFKHYFKTAIRTIQRQRGYSAIHIFGLTIGITCSLFIFLWVQDEFSYDRFHKNLSRLYRVTTETQVGDQTLHGAVTSAPLAHALKVNVPEVVHATRYGRGHWQVRFGEKRFMERAISFVDPDFLQMFSFPLIHGDPDLVLNDPYSILLTTAMVNKYFGDEDPMGKVMRINNQWDCKVTGIVKQVPSNSSLQFDFLMPFEFLRNREDIDFWGAWRYYTFIMLQNASSVEETSQKTITIFHEHEKDERSNPMLQPYGHMHFQSDYLYDTAGTGDLKVVGLFSGLAIFILMIACINFINLTTARSGVRAREVGLRKVVGAQRGDLIKQFFGESMIITWLSLILAVLLVHLCLPWFNGISGKLISLNIFRNPLILWGLIGIVCITGGLSGSYPAIFLSAFQPIHVLKDARGRRPKKSLLRRVLVIFQFALTIMMIVSTIVVKKQVTYMQNKPLGFDKDQVIHLPVRGNVLKSYEAMKRMLLYDPNVLNVTASFQLPFNIGSSPGEMDWEGRDPQKEIRINAGLIDFDYFQTLGMEIVEGRPFSREYSTDATEAYIVNESAVKAMGMKSPIGKRFEFWDTPGRIIGVVRDFHSLSLREQINPVVLKLTDYWFNHVLIRIRGARLSEALDAIQKVWAEINPDYDFEYHFLDETIDRLYKSEQRIGQIVSYFTVIAIIIACLGLLGLVSFITEQRRKEVGIRKVLGSSVVGILILLTKEFVKWVLISNLIALPIAFLVMDRFLQNYAYRISIGFDILVFSGLIALAIAIFTVAFQAIKAASTNPVDSLRYE